MKTIVVLIKDIYVPQDKEEEIRNQFRRVFLNQKVEFIRTYGVDLTAQELTVNDTSEEER
jgi:hypothetical protein